MTSFDASLSHNLLRRLVHQLIGWRLALTVGIALAAGGLWFGWPWLVAAGIAPIILALAPCLLMCGAMCAASLCMRPKQEKLQAVEDDSKSALASESCCHSALPSEPRGKA
jgi:hypothetical protein